MKLLIVTAVQAFQEDIRAILKEAGIKAYSHLGVTGFKELAEESQDSNWFASSGGEHQSAMFYAFVDEELADTTLASVVALNDKQETHSHVHAAVLEINKIV